MFKSVWNFSERYVLNQNIPWLLLMLGALLLSSAPLFYLTIAPLTSSAPIAAEAFEGRPLLNNILLLFHVLLAVVPLVLGPWLFHARFRKDHLSAHRLMGKIYVVTCLVSAATSLPLAFAHPSGFLPRTGFGLLAVAWFVFTLLAYQYARRKDLPHHRRWMFRSYACTYAFVNVKIYGHVLSELAVNVHPLFVKILQSCASWMSNLLLVEIYLAATTFMGVYVGRRLFLRNLRTLPLKIMALGVVFALTAWTSDTFFPVYKPVYSYDPDQMGAGMSAVESIDPKDSRAPAADEN